MVGGGVANNGVLVENPVDALIVGALAMSAFGAKENALESNETGLLVVVSAFGFSPPNPNEICGFSVAKIGFDSAAFVVITGDTLAAGNPKLL